MSKMMCKYRMLVAIPVIVIGLTVSQLVLAAHYENEVVENRTLDLQFGDSADKTTVGQAGVLRLAGGRASLTTINDGGELNIASGLALGTTIYSGGRQMLTGGKAEQTFLNKGALQEVSGGTIATQTVLFSGARQNASQNAVTENLVLAGGDAIIKDNAEARTVRSRSEGTDTFGRLIATDYSKVKDVDVSDVSLDMTKHSSGENIKVSGDSDGGNSKISLFDNATLKNVTLTGTRQIINDEPTAVDMVMTEKTSATNVTIKKAKLNIYGGEVQDVNLSFGHIGVNAGHVNNLTMGGDATTDKFGRDSTVYLSGDNSSSSNVLVGAGGWFHVELCAVVDNITVQKDGHLIVSSGKVSNLTLEDGAEYVNRTKPGECD